LVRIKYNDLIISHKKSVAEINARIEDINANDVNLWQSFEEMQQMYLPLADQVIALRQTPDWNKANFLMANNVAPLAIQLALLLEKVVLNQQEIAKESGFAINTGVENVIWMLVITGIVASLSAFAIAAWLGSNIGSRLNIIAKRAEDISHGDFSGKPLKNTDSDELATLTLAVNRMTDSLSSLVQGVSRKADDVDISMTDLLNINAKTASETQNQANQVGSMATAIEELSVTAKETVRNTQDLSTSLQTSTECLANGEQDLMQNKLTVEELYKLIENANGMVQNLSEESNSIGRVTEVIENLAQQTNLLALNAAIEAARASDMLLETTNLMQDVSLRVSDVAEATDQQFAVSESLASLVHQLSDSANDVSANCDNANNTAQESKNKALDLNKEMQKFEV